MQNIKISPEDIFLLRKILPLICLITPWEFYFYTSDYSSGWGIKFSVLYANFDVQYGTIFVDLLKQLTLLSYGGFLPSLRTITWSMAALLCIAVVFYELFRQNIEMELSIRTIAILLIACAVMTLISSTAVWNSSFSTIPIAPIFFAFSGCLLLYASSSQETE
ncbi:hypothetical protein [Methanolobus halotolerans]|uniref:Uncharacterized protein n=1 Tax=Methanolobus halotolerans TaxID=2052935 RepID=A0A4E0PUS3_9EURY|nr:hypothetical protein [Methanolobus halotolerans]TGC08963.1 hypothetical protein CUN85_07995 [Methanolobus halotolerans]